MKQSLIAVVLITATGLLGTSEAQSQEVVVTGSRIDRYSTETIPFINLKKTADFAIIEAYIESDSRSPDLRREEVTKTLEALIAADGSEPLIELVLKKTFEFDNDEIEYVVPFGADEVSLARGYRPDTTRINFAMKTPVRAQDTDPELLEDRFEDFLNSIETTGRAVVDTGSDLDLSLVNINQYRQPLIAKLAQDSRMVSQILGAGFEVDISGFQQPLRWRVTGPLELTLYFPYAMSVEGAP